MSTRTALPLALSISSLDPLDLLVLSHHPHPRPWLGPILDPLPRRYWESCSTSRASAKSSLLNQESRGTAESPRTLRIARNSEPKPKARRGRAAAARTRTPAGAGNLGTNEVHRFEAHLPAMNSWSPSDQVYERKRCSASAWLACLDLTGCFVIAAGFSSSICMMII